VNLSSTAGRVYFDPWWTASGAPGANPPYSDNSPELTADALYNEAAYFYSYEPSNNVFSFPNYWLNAVQDQVTVGLWNTMLPDGLHK